MFQHNSVCLSPTLTGQKVVNSFLQVDLHLWPSKDFLLCYVVCRSGCRDGISFWKCHNFQQRLCFSAFHCGRAASFRLQGSDSEYEMDQSRQKTHSFVSHYISDPTYYNSWRRQQKGVSRPPAYGYSQPEPLVEQESRQHPPPVPPLPPLLPQGTPSPQPQGQGTLFRPKGSRTPTPSLLSSEPPSQQSTLYRPPSSLGCAAPAPTAGFSSFV